MADACMPLHWRRASCLTTYNSAVQLASTGNKSRSLQHDSECACAAGLVSALTACPARAAKQVTRRDGSTVTAQEFDVDLRLVSLHKSVPQEWPFAFRQAVKGGGAHQLRQALAA